ncbi:MAG: hypothetical protein EA397_11435 [Deltaproteobacteria bacterium]|nr:MAG: hypothetical protein EA397_11435 [Deltaproteobacteria bacterium]
MSVRVVLLAAVALFASCAVSLQGAVYPDERGRAILHLPDGSTKNLVLDEAAAPLAYLDGEGVEIEGLQWIRGINVKNWTVPDGTRGLQVWVGVLEVHQGTLRVFDRNARAPYVLDARDHPELHRAVGQTVLVEGWVVGANAVRVAYAKVLGRVEAAR